MFRNSTRLLTFANLTKVYVGISIISVTQGVVQAGIYGFLVAIAYVATINLYCLWILLQARNRFKYDRIIDLPDLSARIYGEGSRIYV